MLLNCQWFSNIFLINMEPLTLAYKAPRNLGPTCLPTPSHNALSFAHYTLTILVPTFGPFYQLFSLSEMLLTYLHRLVSSGHSDLCFKLRRFGIPLHPKEFLNIFCCPFQPHCLHYCLAWTIIWYFSFLFVYCLSLPLTKILPLWEEGLACLTHDCVCPQCPEQYLAQRGKTQ